MKMDSRGGMKAKAHVVVLSFPATSHTNPMLQFSKNLASRGLLVTFVSFNVNYHKVIQAKEFVERLKLNIRFECISDGLPKDAPDSNLNPSVFKHMMDMAGDPGLEPLIHRLNADANSPPVCCIVYNSFLPWVRHVANKIKIPHALFWTQSAAVFAIYHHFRNGEGWDRSRMPQNITVPGLPKLNLLDLPSAFREETGFLQYYLRQLESIKDASWVPANTVCELERDTIESITSTSIPFRAIGPSVPWAFLDEHNNKDDTQVGADPWQTADFISWLNDKPPQSVVYISFGSITVIKPDQIREMALGIQRCQQNFVWVIRPPPGHGHIEELLPPQFLEETKQRGLVVDWCDQLKVLSHPSIGAFMSHCGWNSTLDALSLGVPILAFGIWTDQPTNSKLITDVWKTGVRVQRREDGSVGWEEVERSMRMGVASEEGRRMRNNALEWRERVRAAAREGGSSHTNLDDFAQEIVIRSRSQRNIHG